MQPYFVYILTNRMRTLYIGVTSNLERRVWEHKHHVVDGFTAHYRINQLVYFEAVEDKESAVAREKQLKGWRREKKVWLIERENPDWRDLAKDWDG